MSLTVRDLRLARENGFTLEVGDLGFGVGRITAVIGPNGSGKSTLLRAIAGLEPTAAGTVRFAGDPVRRETLAFCFQERVFVEGTVRKNLQLALSLRGVPRRMRDERVAEVAGELGIEHLLDRATGKLSGGEQQRVNLARTLALRAPIALLDEALASVDAETRERLLAELPAILRRHAQVAVVVAHDRREALGMSDRVVVMREGRVIATGAKAELFERPPDTDTARALGMVVLEDERAGARYAVAENDLRFGDGGGNRFGLVVERVIDVGGYVEVSGRCGGAVVAVRVARGDAVPGVGDVVTVAATRVVEMP